MTFAHLGTFIAGIVLAVVASDIAGHRGIPRWPVALGALVLTCVGGYFYSTWVTAFGLGAVLTCGFLLSVDGVRRVLERRRALAESARARSTLEEWQGRRRR